MLRLFRKSRKSGTLKNKSTYMTALEFKNEYDRISKERNAEELVLERKGNSVFSVLISADHDANMLMKITKKFYDTNPFAYERELKFQVALKSIEQKRIASCRKYGIGEVVNILNAWTGSNGEANVYYKDEDSARILNATITEEPMVNVYNGRVYYNADITGNDGLDAILTTIHPENIMTN